MTAGTIYRFSAFSSHPEDGNPAGVWIGDTLPESGVMHKIAADVGFSETAFIAPSTGKDRTVRYFSPEAEVSFCGHASMAAGVVLGEAEGDGTYRLSTAVRPGPRDSACQSLRRGVASGAGRCRRAPVGQIEL